jgi:hypothetical protein
MEVPIAEEVAMKRRALVVWAAVVVAVAVLSVACGGDGPSSPSGAGVVVKGTVLGSGGTLRASANTPAVAAAAQKVTVNVLGTTLTAEVAANGTFELKGVTSGSFTLVFLVDGREIGRVEVDATAGSEVKVVVEIKDSKLVVIEIKVEGGASPAPGPTATPVACLVNGGKVNEGIELEGNVSASKPASAASFAMTAAGATGVVDVDATGASYRCIGNAKTPTDAECRASLKAGAKVHVRGSLTACSAQAASVKAVEVKIQKD